jgi:hypothetical protein
MGVRRPESTKIVFYVHSQIADDLLLWKAGTGRFIGGWRSFKKKEGILT